ncbi:MAG: c-type cytochrome [Burkholderiaceae bacterium]
MAQTAYPGVGRPATPKEVKAWDIDVRPDFKGLPKGSGSVAKGQDVWEGKCASCHGVFGESNEVFSPLVGGTTKDDVKTGRVARLNDTGFPGRTTLMKVSTVSTLWDYINRAMPWNAPKSLSNEEVYAVTAYLLNMGGVVPDSYTLSDANIADVQKLLPNRNGVTTDHGMWPGKGMGNGGKPDVKAVACMKDCTPEPKVASFLPDFARNNHGNLAEQQRVVGPQRGADTTKPPAANPGAAAAAAATTVAAPKAAADSPGAAALALAQKYTCTACHGAETKIVGPGFKEIATKYAGRNDAEAYLAGKIKAGAGYSRNSTPTQ